MPIKIVLVTVSIAAASLFFLPASALAQADSSGPDPEKRTHPVLFVSPAGKPYRANMMPDLPHPVRTWFQSADRNDDGEISLPEFRADFEEVFGEYDSDGNDQIDAFEVRHYEQNILPELHSAGSVIGRGGADGRRGAGRGKNRGGRGQRGRGGKKRSEGVGKKLAARSVGGAARFGLLPIYHPLLDADADMSWRVSKAEFMKAADNRFRYLDAVQTGTLKVEALEEKLPKRKMRRSKKQR